MISECPTSNTAAWISLSVYILRRINEKNRKKESWFSKFSNPCSFLRSRAFTHRLCILESERCARPMKFNTKIEFCATIATEHASGEKYILPISCLFPYSDQLHTYLSTLLRFSVWSFKFSPLVDRLPPSSK